MIILNKPGDGSGFRLPKIAMKKQLIPFKVNFLRKELDQAKFEEYEKNGKAGKIEKPNKKDNLKNMLAPIMDHEDSDEDEGKNGRMKKSSETGDSRIENNIFTQKKEVLSLHSLGPTYDSNGEIVRYSIIGKVEKFQEMDRRLRKNNPKGTLSKVYKQQTFNDDTVSQGNQSKFDDTASKLNGVSRQNTSKKVKEVRKIQVTKGDLLREIELLEDMSLQQKSIEDDSHDMKVIRKFQKTVKNWKSCINHLSSKIKRNPQDSVIVNTESFRQKMEMAKSMSILRSHEQAQSKNFWTENLRNYIKPCDLEHLETCTCNETVEIIRKPEVIYYTKDIELLAVENSEFKTLMLENRKDLEKNRAYGNDLEFPKLMVTGRSVLEIERDMLFHDKSKESQTFFKFLPNKQGSSNL